MARYKYVIGTLFFLPYQSLTHSVPRLGETPHEFLQMKANRQIRADLKNLRTDIALLAVNDDIDAQPELVGPILTQWMANRWRIRAEWES